MKKFLFVLIGLVVAGNALGAHNCTVYTCPPDAPKGEKTEYILSQVGGNQCYSCDSNDYSFNNHQCAYGAVVGQLDRQGRVIGIYSCNDTSGSYDQWWKSNPGGTCKTGSDLVAPGETPETFDTFYSLDGGIKTKDYKDNENVIRAGGSDACVYYKCKDSFVPNNSDYTKATDCVKPETLCSEAQVYENGQCVEKESGCKQSGGTWNTTTKKCDCESSNTTRDATGYVCECKSGYNWNNPADKSKGCYDVAVAAQNKTNKEKCENTGGEWKNSACSCDANKNLVKNGNVCKCKSSDYQYNTAQKKCIITDIAKQKEICTKIPGATWGEVSNECICADLMQKPDMDRKVCVYPDGYEACKAKSTIADWTNGKCVCKQSGYSWNGVDCIKGAGLELEELYADIQNLESKYATKISKWKDAEGNFNTARLASDSIAGVVLGTVGGVVTSTIIKKNQVEDGFEDLKCAIGGQSVATWGDEFQVGLQ